MEKLGKKKIKIANNEELAYVEEGINNKKKVLLIHGNFSSSLHYIVLINNLKEKYHVLAPDMRGFGDSTYNNKIDTLKDLAFDLKLFLEAKKIEKIDCVIGWSLGGGVAMEFCANFPEVSPKMVLIASTTHKGYPVYKKDKNMQPTGEPYKNREEMATDPVQVAPLLMMINTKNFELMSQAFRAMYVKDPDKELNKIMVEDSLKQKNLVDADWAISTINMSNTPNPYNKGDGTIKNIKAKTLHMWGVMDLYLAPEFMTLDNYNALKENSIYKKYNSSHMIFIDDEINAKNDIIDFIEGKLK